jgi:hypothetical protein
MDPQRRDGLAPACGGPGQHSLGEQGKSHRNQRKPKRHRYGEQERKTLNDTHVLAWTLSGSAVNPDFDQCADGLGG